MEDPDRWWTGLIDSMGGQDTDDLVPKKVFKQGYFLGLSGNRILVGFPEGFYSARAAEQKRHLERALRRHLGQECKMTLTTVKGDPSEQYETVGVYGGHCRREAGGLDRQTLPIIEKMRAKPRTDEEIREAFGERYTPELHRLAQTPRDYVERGSDEEWADGVKLEIAKHPVKGEQLPLPLSITPTDFIRTSPFLPARDQDKKGRYVIKEVSYKTSWGEITIRGPDLYTREQDILLVILAILRATKSRKTVKTKQGDTYVVGTTLGRICRYLNLKRGKALYDSIINSLELLGMTLIRLKVKDKKKKTLKLRMFGTIISSGIINTETGKLALKLNPYFYRMFGEELTTLHNLAVYRKLKTRNGKHLMVFYDTHAGNPKMHIDTLAKSIKIGDRQPKGYRRSVRRALHDLENAGYLISWTITKQGMVLITKRPGLKRRMLPEKK